MTGARLARRAGVVLVLAAAGLLFATSALTSGGTDLRSETADLGTVIAQRSRDNAEQSDQVSSLRADVDRLSRSVSTTVEDDPLDDPALGVASGALAATGPGVQVTLDDAPADSRPASAAPDDLVVHQQDVEAVVNALWAGGAEAMMIMDQRVVSTSAVRCVGNVLVLQGRTYSPPYTITALGDVDALRTSLDDSAEVSIYQQYVAVYGLGYQVSQDDDLELPAFDGTTTLEHARALENPQAAS